MLGHWTCHTSVGLVILKLGLRPRLIFSIKSILVLDLHVGIVDLSHQDGKCHFEAEPNIKLGFWSCMLGHWTLHCSIGLVILKLGVRPDPCVPQYSCVLKPREAAGHQKEEPRTYSDGHQSAGVIRPFSKPAAVQHGPLQLPEFSQNGRYLSYQELPKAKDPG